MKKSFIVALACGLFAVNAANAQNNTYYGSQKGGFSISIDAEPLLDYVGNMFNASTENYLFGVGSGLFGRYFVSDQWTVGVGFGFDRMKGTSFAYMNDDMPNDITEKEGAALSTFDLSIGGEYLLRPGQRLQPFVGLYAVIGGTNDVMRYEQIAFENANGKQESEMLKTSTPCFVYGAQANLGVEYFMSKNISISVIMGLGAYFYTVKSVSKYETSGNLSQEVIESLNFNKVTSKSSWISSDFVSGNIAFNFYF